MTRILTFPAAGRLLVFAPHPDDETLASGELIQLALAAGAVVRVIFATDGDNNPWPQRWSERRWRIGAAERARWGHRRRAEAEVALAKLGVPRESARFLGWPDLGLTQKLEQDDAAIDVLAAEIAAYAPTHVAMPSLHDRHPDHGALHVMVELALRKSHTQCVCLGYVVHGRTPDSGEWLLPRDPDRHRRKREALLAHTSQTSLSRKRLLRWASEPESFEQAEPNGSGSITAPTAVVNVLRIPLLPTHRFWRRHDVLVVLVDGEKIERARVRLPRIVRSRTSQLLGAALCGGRVSIELSEGTLEITVAASHHPGDVSGYVKLERTQPRLLIFDVETWRRFEDIAPSHMSAAVHVEPVAIAQRASL